MKGLTRLTLLAFSITMTLFALQSHRTAVLAAGDCTCDGNSYGYQYQDNTYMGSSSFHRGPFFSAANYYCANSCQVDAWNNGSALCTTYGLCGGVGYVRLIWTFVYEGAGSIYTQQYDCDDL